MGLFSTMNIASTGLTAEKLNMDVISNNLANVNTTRTPEGGAYRRRFAVFSPRQVNPTWKSPNPFLPKALTPELGQGVRVDQIAVDRKTPYKWRYDPSNPDAIKTGKRAGWVEMPNINVVTEMVNFIAASRAYQANLTVIKDAQQSFLNVLDTLKI